LLLSLSMKVDKCVNKVGDTSTNVEEIDKLVVKVKVKEVRHLFR